MPDTASSFEMDGAMQPRMISTFLQQFSIYCNYSLLFWSFLSWKVELLLDAYWSWVEKQDPASGNKLEEAVTYARNQKENLNAFLAHGEVDISNNAAENAIRPFVVGRKNWLFSDTPKGADSSAIVYTMVESAKANGLEPGLYLRCLLEELRFLGHSLSAADLEDFMPLSPMVRKMMEKYNDVTARR